MKKEVELAIIGAGIAGVSAAVYAKRCNLNFSLFESGLIGGQLSLMEDIDNYIGLGTGVKGPELARKLDTTLADLEIKITAENIQRVEVKDKNILLHSANSIYSARGAIIATGASFRRLGLKGEAEFSGKGVSYCAVCDGFFFKGKDIAVVGGGNTAVEEALYLSNIARKVILIHRRCELRALDYLREKIQTRHNIEVVFNSVIKQIEGDRVLKTLTLENVQSHKLTQVAIDGLFVAIGAEPNTRIFREITAQDENGFIITDETMQTRSEFIWAAGDCRRRPLRQLITAAAEGAIASISAYRYLRGGYLNA